MPSHSNGSYAQLRSIFITSEDLGIPLVLLVRIKTKINCRRESVTVIAGTAGAGGEGRTAISIKNRLTFFL
jgi:hypothetical protein